MLKVMHSLRYFRYLVLVLLLGACSSENDLDFPNIEIPLPEALLEIYYPYNGATLAANQSFTLKYDVVRGDTGAYVKIQINDEVPAIINKTSGQHHIEALPPGTHSISLTEYTKSDVATGGFVVIHITMK